ncbi:hypothetical protein [Maricaulis sp.]|uniref:hypothetical protein n=1 Tax=Maricaulis sp. TaxID=1486257 RepID=UPI00260D2B39|nr:hypothetical protein [Maricaulis sp.]
MILARISRAIREQNWFAVALEFVIVIAGVVIGFQITAWNADRQDRVAESMALARIQQDIEQNIAELSERIDRNAEQDENFRILADAVTAGSVRDEDRAAFEDGMARILYFSRPPLSQPSYDALEQSGDLALIRSDRLMTQLNELRSDLLWVQSQQASFRSGLSSMADYWRPYVFHTPTSVPVRTAVRVDLDGLASDPQAASAVVEATRMHAIFSSYLVRYLDQLQSVCREIARETGQPCEASP